MPCMLPIVATLGQTLRTRRPASITLGGRGSLAEAACGLGTFPGALAAEPFMHPAGTGSPAMPGFGRATRSEQRSSGPGDAGFAMAPQDTGDQEQRANDGRGSEWQLSSMGRALRSPA